MVILASHIPGLPPIFLIVPPLFLNQSEPSSYRPISNVPVLSKILERLVLEKTRSFLVENDLFPSFQSAYRPFHSTETTITKIHMDTLEAADEGSFSFLILIGSFLSL